MEQDPRTKKSVRKYNFPFQERDSENQRIQSGTELASDVDISAKSPTRSNQPAKKPDKKPDKKPAKNKIQKFSFPLYENEPDNLHIPYEKDSESDSGRFFLGASTQFVYDELARGLYNRSPLLVLIGPAGVGKTELICRISTHLSRDYEFIYANDSYSSFKELMEPLCVQFDLDPKKRTVSQLSKLLYSNFTNAKQSGIRYIFVVDNAQDMASEILTNLMELVILTNLMELVGVYKRDNPSFQILLSGRPSLEEKFQGFDLKKVRQNSTTWVQLTNLSGREVENFIEFLLETDSPKNENSFGQDVIKRIASYSRGNPRLTHALCNLALFNATLEGNSDNSITVESIDEAARQCMLTKVPENQLTENGKNSNTAESYDETIIQSLPKDKSVGQAILKNQLPNAELPICNPKVVVQDSSKSIHESTNQAADSRENNTCPPELLYRGHAVDAQMPVVKKNLEEENKKVFTELTAKSPSGKFLAKEFKIVPAIIIATFLPGSLDKHDTKEIRTQNLKNPSINAIASKPESDDIQLSFLQKPEVDVDLSAGSESKSKPIDGNPNNSASRQRLDGMLEKASMLMRKKLLTSPPGNNALQTYKRILSVYPDQKDARYGILRIKRIYQKWGLSAEMRGDLIRAKNFYSRALKAAPRDKVTITALNHVEKKLSYQKTYSSDRY